MAEPANELIDAARSAKARGDWDAAYRLLRQAGTDDDLPIDALADLGQAAWWLGHTTETIDLTERVHERCLADGALDRAAEHAVDLAFTWFLRGDPTLGLGWHARARRLVDGRPDSLAAGLVHYIDAALALETSDNDKASVEAHTLQAMGDALDSATLTALGMAVEGIVLIRRGELDQGFGLLDEAMLPVVAEHVLPEYAGDIYCRIISVSVDLADLDRARRWIATMQRWCDGFSTAAMFAGVCRVHRAQLMREAGALDDAERDARRTCDELADINRGTVGEACYELGEIHRLRGNLDDAATWYARAEDGGHSAEPGTSLLLLCRGQPKASLRRISAAVAAAESPFSRARLSAARVEIALAAEEPGVAEQAASELDGIAARFGTVGLRAASLYAQGSLLLAGGDCDHALSVLTDAHALYSRSARPYAQARVHALLARCYRARGQLDAASTHAEAASALFDRMRVAPPDAPVRTRHPGGLTDREIDVLRHVAAGESNRQIADALTISDKTVGRHLSNIYTKLGLGSRSAATAWAYENGLHADDSLQHPL